MTTVDIATRPCIVCGKNSIMTIPKEGLSLWQSGYKIQHAFPDMPKEQREMLITGTHPECWEVLWPEGRED